MPPYTIHTSRTIMYKELSDLIAQRLFFDNQILESNPIYKATRSNLQKTIRHLSKLYSFDSDDELWQIFVYLFKKANDSEKRLLTIIYALFNDELLSASIPLILETKLGTRIPTHSIQKILQGIYPDKYTQITLSSSARNIASSWKQAGFIQGKVKNIRVHVHPGYLSVLFAMYLGYQTGLRDKELFTSKWGKLLEMPESKIRESLSIAALNEFIDYRYAGGVTVLNFDKLNQLAGNELKS